MIAAWYFFTTVRLLFVVLWYFSLRDSMCSSIWANCLLTAIQYWLAQCLQIAHAPATTTTSGSDVKSNSPQSSSSTPLINHPSLRYHPYMKPSGLLPSVPNPLGVPSFPTVPSFPSAAALQAMYTQRLLATMPHPWQHFSQLASLHNCAGILWKMCYYDVRCYFLDLIYYPVRMLYHVHITATAA